MLLHVIKPKFTFYMENGQSEDDPDLVNLFNDNSYIFEKRCLRTPFSR